ncbi:MAG: sugar phosphate isomerase/epimerase [Verrucomicrobiales bacterium]|nr:sugar phosphate isomerase/epimerase [Verrucomicrobiales bacterium]
MLALSTCWNNHRFSDGMDLAKEIRAMGFEWIEISHGTKVSLLPGLLNAYQQGIVRVTSLHNFCPSPVEVMMDAPDVYEFTSHRQIERERAISLTKATIQMARRFGVDRVVMHMGSVPMKSITKELEKFALSGGIYSRPYTEAKLRLVAARDKASAFYLERAREALRELLPSCEEHGVRLAVETRSHYEQIPNEKEMLLLLNDFADSPWIGAWHDFGHVQRKANLGLLDHAEFLAQISPRLLGCHVHDVEWPARDHRIPLTTGGVDFPRLLPLLPQGIPLVWELSPSQKRLRIMEQRDLWVKNSR